MTQYHIVANSYGRTYILYISTVNTCNNKIYISRIVFEAQGKRIEKQSIWLELSGHGDSDHVKEKFLVGLRMKQQYKLNLQELQIPNSPPVAYGNGSHS
jgi:hypothetical protein